jgi:hypothetical protein
LRIEVLALAAGVGAWAKRWRQRPEMIAWAVALALALRIYFEPVMDAYYAWPALAVGLVVAARGHHRRFVVSIAIAMLTTVVAQWRLGWFPWWVIDVGGTTALLVVASRPQPLATSGKDAAQGAVAVSLLPGRGLL